jgi:hypothetical protein
MNIKILFKSLYYNGNLGITVVVNDKNCATWNSQQPSTEQQTISFDVDSSPMEPVHLLLKFDNKSQDLDTQVDEDGNILQDKAVVIDQIVIDNIAIYQELFLCPFTTDDGRIIKNSAYFGFNGIFDVDIQPNIFQWLGNCKTLLSLKESHTTYEKFLKEIMQ